MSAALPDAVPATAAPSRPGPLRRHVPLLLGFAVLAALPLLVPSFFTGVATRGMAYGLAAAALGFLIPHGGMISLGHAAYLGAGAYAVLLCRMAGLHEALLVWPIAALSGGALALILGALSLRTRGVYFIMITLSFAQMLYIIFSSLQGLGSVDGIGLPARNTLAGLPLEGTVLFHYVVLVLLAGGLLLLGALSRSAFGLALRGVRDNERRMRAAGFRTTRLMLAAFTLSGAITGLAGALVANFYLFVSPAFLHWLLSGELLVMVILGGLGGVAGPVLGAFALIAAETALSEWTTYWRVILGPAVILVVLFLPQGLSGWRRRGETGGGAGHG